VADGIDTVSSIYINDKLIGTTDNMFIRYKFDAKHILKNGENKIRIAFESAVHYAHQKYEHYKTAYNYSIEGISLKKKCFGL
jgi:beta-mannosidase